MTTLQALHLAETILEGLSELNFRGNSTKRVPGKQGLSVRLKAVDETWKCGFAIVRIGNNLSLEDLHLIWRPTTRKYLSQKLQKPLKILLESGGDIAFIVSLRIDSMRYDQPRIATDLPNEVQYTSHFGPRAATREFVPSFVNAVSRVILRWTNGTVVRSDLPNRSLSQNRQRLIVSSGGKNERKDVPLHL